jgi:anti-sigma factor RsiW
VINEHLSDETLSALLDEAGAPERAEDRAHLSGCPTCERRLGELRSVVDLLRGLPEVEPIRSFTLGPQPVAEPAGSNVVRLRRWYVAARTAGASLAAVFVLLVGGATYLDMTAVPSSPPTTRALAPEAKPAAGAAPAAPAAASPAPTPAPALAIRAPQKPAPADNPDQNEQRIATTGARPLPTLTPVPLPPPIAAVVEQAPAGDPGAPLRVIASVVGVLAVLSLLLAVILRHRLGHQHA